jgi:FtsZ-interacting cell division protein ZipA
MDSILIYVVLAVAIIALLFFVIRRNNKDRKEFEQQLNEDYKKTEDKEDDIETEIHRDSKT